MSTTTRLYAAGGLRSFVIGLTGVLFGLYLARLGAGAGTVGLLVGLGLAGTALGTLFVAFLGERFGRRRALLLATGLGGLGLAGLALIRTPAWLGLVAFAGMINGMGRDRGPAQTLEQSLLADVVADSGRVTAFTRYTLSQDILGALGALAAGLPDWLHRALVLPLVDADRVVFALAAAIALLPLALYSRLSAPTHDRGTPLRSEGGAAPLTAESRRRVAGLASLFALDSLGGGFLAGAILAYWFFQRFGLSSAAIGVVFFLGRGLNAGSYLVATWLTHRIGHVRTMVFTHLPSSGLLMLLPLAATPTAAIALFLARESLVQMDVPARQSYVAAVTRPGERTFALGVTSVVRNVGWSLGPPLAGSAMNAFGLAAPLWIGASLKVVYDLALFGSFRHVRPPEEGEGA